MWSGRRGDVPVAHVRVLPPDRPRTRPLPLTPPRWEPLVPTALLVLTGWLVLSVLVVAGLAALFAGSRLGERRARRGAAEAAEAARLSGAQVVPLHRLPLAG